MPESFQKIALTTWPTALAPAMELGSLARWLRDTGFDGKFVPERGCHHQLYDEFFTSDVIVMNKSNPASGIPAFNGFKLGILQIIFHQGLIY